MNQIKHIEIVGVHGENLESFYASLLDWKIERQHPGGFDYGHVQLNDGLSAGIRHEPDGPAEIVIYFEVDDVQAKVEEAVKLGATVRIPPMESGAVCFALLEDPEGNSIGLTQERSSDGGGG